MRYSLSFDMWSHYSGLVAEDFDKKYLQWFKEVPSDTIEYKSGTEAFQKISQKYLWLDIPFQLHVGNGLNLQEIMGLDYWTFISCLGFQEIPIPQIDGLLISKDENGWFTTITLDFKP